MSSIIIVAMLVIAMIGWLPRRTVDSMKQVIEHREDRFSPSLHLVDGDSGTQFSDVRGPLRIGAVMQDTHMQDSALDLQRIARIRHMRRLAARRRSILVVVLLAVTLVVMALALTVPFSMWFVLIPAMPLAVVLGLGIRVARHAREWEQAVARRMQDARPTMKAKAHNEHASKRVATTPVSTSPSGPTAIGAAPGDNAHTQVRIEDSEERPRRNGEMPTDVMEQREIRRALRQSRDERDKALARRRHDAGDTGARGSASEHDAPVNSKHQPVELSVERPVSTNGAATSDATNELDAVHASHALDAFDMASQQDLISFSLGGSPHNHEQSVSAGPESREIKSTRQVAQARPTVSKAASDDVDPVRDVRAFHEREVDSDVDVPEPTSDSLGADLQAVLARRAS